MERRLSLYGGTPRPPPPPLPLVPSSEKPPAYVNCRQRRGLQGWSMYVDGSIIGAKVDCDRGTLEFTVNDRKHIFEKRTIGFRKDGRMNKKRGLRRMLPKEEEEEGRPGCTGSELR
ncbi:unnamed protein product [Nippostrongylus brasiliensis]|uniref:SPRY domain-containing protein n=1 Tax=Nippostrongylus brasiliensis TaxID=27835 RepID=A0A0N4XGV9_NIPBR|nr:unnamed protein product [Nippostrongylus brasiliensis]